MDLEMFIPEVTKVYEFIRVTVVFRNGEKIDIMDELKKTKIKRGLFWIEVKGRFNHTRINKLNIGMINISVHSKDEVLSDERRNSQNSVRRDG